jgi:hypothetical protein
MPPEGTTDRETAEPGASPKSGRLAWRRAFRLEVVLYLRHLRGLALPGLSIKPVIGSPPAPEPIVGWDVSALELVVEEGRRQLDRQAARFDRIRTTAQLLFTTALALLVVLGASANRVLDSEPPPIIVLWGTGLVLVTLGMLGAASVLTTAAVFGAIDAARFTASRVNQLLDLATAYAAQVQVGEVTLAERLTVYRDAVWLVMLGAVVQLVVWLSSIS